VASHTVMILQYFPDWSVHLETFECRLVIIYCLLIHAQGLKRISCLEINVLSLLCANKKIQEERSIILEVIASVIVRKKVHMSMCPIVNCYRDRAVWICKQKIAFWMVKETEKSLTVNLILILFLKHKFAPQKWQIYYSSQSIFENPTVNLSALCNSRVKIACCSSELIFTSLYAGNNIQHASEQFVPRVHLSFVNFAIHPTPRIKMLDGYVWRFKQLHLDKNSQLDTRFYEIFLHKMTSAIKCQIIDPLELLRIVSQNRRWYMMYNQFVLTCKRKESCVSK
jgi:hypothetical protein